MSFDVLGGVKLLLLDTETGGLDADDYSLLSVGLQVLDKGVFGASDEFFVAEPEIAVEPVAMSFNKIDLDWLKRTGIDVVAAVARLEAFLDEHFPVDQYKTVIVGGHNVWFDVNFLNRLYRLAGRRDKARFKHRRVDSAAILQFLFMAGRLPIEATDSNGAFAHFGIEFEAGERHTALKDARGTGQLLLKLAEMVGSDASATASPA